MMKVRHAVMAVALGTGEWVVHSRSLHRMSPIIPSGTATSAMTSPRLPMVRATR